MWLLSAVQSQVFSATQLIALVYSTVHLMLRERVKPLRMKNINLVLDYLENQSWEQDEFKRIFR